MSLSGDSYSQHQFRHALALQTTWNTGITADASYRQLYLTDVPAINWGEAPSASNRHADGSILAHIHDTYRQERGADPSVPLKGIVTNEVLPYLLRGVMQNMVSQSGIAPHMRTHRWADAFTGMSGLVPETFFSFAEYDPAGTSARLKNCVITRLKLSADPGSQGGLLLFEADLKSFGIPDRAPTLDPSAWVDKGTTVFGWNSIAAVTLASNDLLYSGWELTIENGAAAAQALDTNGNRQCVRLAAPKVTASVKAMHDGNTKGCLADFLASPMDGSADKALYLRYGAAESSAQMLAITVNVIYTGNPDRDPQPDGVYRTLPFEGARDGVNHIIEVKNANNTNISWT